MIKKSFLCPVLLLFSFLPFTGAQDTLLLFHPTADNLQVIEFLSRKNLLDLKGYHIVGVYLDREEYDYGKSEEILTDLPERKYSLLRLEGPLEASGLFGLNSCTDNFRSLFRGSRGALFLGGPDIPPGLYREPTYLLTRVTDPFRHFLELSFLFHLLGDSRDPLWTPFLEEDPGYLIVGICLGMQTLNVATGGTLIQDIPTELYRTWSVEQLLAMPTDQLHRNYADMISTGCETPTSYHFHRIRLHEDSFLTKGMTGKEQQEPLVLSSHHQAVGTLGPEWRVSATSMDGRVIEAMEHRKYPHVWGVQFHPEKPGLFDPDIVHPESCSRKINFREVIYGTDSYPFHISYWEHVGFILQDRRSRAIQSQ